MANCIVCSKSLGMLNTPMFGKGATKDGGTICSACATKLIMSNFSSVKLKEHTSAEVLGFFDQIALNKEQKSIQKEQAVQQKTIEKEQAEQQKAIQKEQAEQQKTIEKEQVEQAEQQRAIEKEQAEQQKTIEKEQARQQKSLEKEQARADRKEAFEQKVADYKNDIAQKNNRVAELKQIILKLNPSVVNKREISELPSILMADEMIEKIDSGYLEEGKGATNNGLLIATNYRVIFIDKGLLSGIKMEDFPYDKISSVSVETGFLKGVVKIICSGNTAKINLVTGAKEFSEFIRQKTMTKPTAAVQPVIINEPDILGQIEKLAALKEKGILTEQEFSDKKAVLLSKL